MKYLSKRLISPVVIRWFFSYLLILLISIVAGLGTSIYARRISFQQAHQTQKGLMAQVQMDIDSSVNSIYSLLQRITFNKNIARINDETAEDDRYSVYLAAADFKTYLYENNSIASVFLYDPLSKKILSSAGYLDADYYYSLYYPNILQDFESFESQLLAEGHRNDIYLETSDGKQLIAFTQKIVPINSMREMQATIVLNPASLIQRMDYLRWDESISIAIQFKRDQVIAQAGSLKINSAADINTQNPNDFYTTMIDGEEYGVFVSNSQSTSWSYVTYVKTDVMYQAAGRIGMITVISILFLSTFGMLLSYHFSIKNYQPLRETIDVMAEYVKPSIDDNPSRNEYVWLKKALTDYSDRFQANAKMLKNYNLYVKNHLLFRLLETPFRVDRDHRELQRAEWSFNEPYFLVVNFYYNDAQAISISTSIEQGKRALSLAILSTFEQFTHDQCMVEMIDMGDRVSAIINLPDRSEQTLEQIKELVQHCQDEIENDLSVLIHASIGTIHAGIAEIYLSSNEAKEAAGFISSQNRDSIVLYDDIKNLRLAYHYPLELEQQIISYILVGNEEQAIADAKRVFRQNESLLTGDMYKCLVLDMLGTIIKAANQTDAPNIVNDINIYEIVSNEDSQQHILRAISTISREVLRERSSSKKNAVLVSSVKQFVEEHYEDTELNVSSIGKHFYLTPAYLSSIFKDETGVSLLDFINMVRIEASKQLLEKRVNVNDVAIAVGYKASGSFIRTFKRIVGTTPGQWTNQKSNYRDMA